jgi:hydroxylamine reductase
LAGVKHIVDKDFSAVVAMALSMDGFTDEVDNGSVMVGFARNAVLGVADKVIEAVKSKAIRHFFLVGGCDGANPAAITSPNLSSRCPMTAWF